MNLNINQAMADVMNKIESDRKRLFTLSYKTAHDRVAYMSSEDKLRIAAEIEELELVSLYESVQYYKDGVPQPDEPWMTTEQFLDVMNKIKHWEQILEWLYEFQFDIPLDMEV